MIILNKQEKIMREFMVKISVIFFLFLVLFLITACNDAADITDIKYTYSGCVDSTKHQISWGRTFSLRVYYHYTVNNFRFSANYADPNSKEPSLSTAWVNEGDSILVGYSLSNPSKSIILKRTYIKSKNYHIPIRQRK